MNNIQYGFYKKPARTLVRIVDDDELFATSEMILLSDLGWNVKTYSSAIEFLEKDELDVPGCLILDVRMADMTGLELQDRLIEMGCGLPIIFLTGHSDVPMAVNTMRQGAVDFFDKPVKIDVLDAAVRRAVDMSLEQAEKMTAEKEFFKLLTLREQQVIRLVIIDKSNKEIADELQITESTVKMHRSRAFLKLGVKSALECYRALEGMGVDVEKFISER